MRKAPAFTLIELLLATAISGVIILGIMQGYRNAQKMLERSNRLMDADHASCLFFNQIERDFMTAIIPEEAKQSSEPKPNEEKKEPEEKKPDEKKADTKETDKKKKEKPLFYGTIEKEQTQKILGKKYEPFKSVSFVNTNPLQVWGQKKTRLVRILYYLKKNKEKSKDDNIVYNLYRKETADIKNDSFKKYEDEKKNKEYPIRKNIVAKNVKEVFIRYIVPKKKKTDETTSKKTKAPTEWLKIFEWGNNEETKNKVPSSIELRISLWDDSYKDFITYNCMIPIISYPTKPKKEISKNTDAAAKKKEEEDKKKKDEAAKKEGDKPKK
jgi:prepilin-type N-terminal cleavage/methylation domain-containing protein